MSVHTYWKERLAEGCPTMFYRQEGIDVKHRADRMADLWPHSVCRASLLDDYGKWHDQVFLEPYRKFEYYRNNPDALPKPADQLAFFTTLAPWIYVVGKKQQTRNYTCDVQELSNGQYITVQKGRYFVRLAELRFHIAAFEQQTCSRISDPSVYFDPDRAMVMHDGALEFLRLIKEGLSE
jgi:hypothetical protein